MVGRHQDASLQEVVEGRLFVVPDYQRPYAWEQKHLRDLWDDLDLMGPEGRHYTGTLVLRRRPVDSQSVSGESFGDWEVVDGQQRLTTILLLVDRLQRRLSASGTREAEARAKALRSSFGDVQVDWSSRPRITLAGELNEFWHRTILHDEPTALPGLQTGHRLLRQAADLFDTWILELADPDPTRELQRLSDLAWRVTQGLRFLVYEVDSSADVGVIFETLNDRGRDLTELEKIKNYLLYLARQMPEHAREELVLHINDAWSDIFKNFAAAPNVNEYSVLRAHWIATQDGDARRWKGTATVKARFPRANYVNEHDKLMAGQEARRDDPQKALRDDLMGYVDSLHLCSLYARELHSTEAQFVAFSSHQKESRAAGEKLRNAGLGLVRFYPVVFAARLRYPQDGHFYTQLVSLCETFAVRVLLVGQWRAHTGSSSINRHGRTLYRDKLAPQDFLAQFTNLIRYYVDDNAMASHLDRPDNWYTRRGHKFVLYEYELSLLRRGARPPSFTEFAGRHQETTEHILPQTPRRGSTWTQVFSPEDRNQLTDSLGNLMLTMDNSRYSNHDYAIKRGTPDAPADTPCYYRGALQQERDLADAFDEWTPETIRTRQSQIKEWMMTRWALPAAPQLEDQVTEDEALEDASLDDNAMDDAERGPA